MKKPTIFLLFAALSAVLLPLPAAAAAELPLRVTGEGAEEQAPQLRAAYLRLVRFFRLNPRRPVATLEIALSPAVPADSPEYRVLDASRHLIVCNPAGGLFSLPAAARRRLYGAMLLTLVPNPNNTSPDFLPGWLSLGLDQALASRESSERWVRGNRFLPVLRGLAGHGGMPSFAALESLAADPSEPDPAAAEWIGEMARCRIALMGKNFLNPRALAEFLRRGGGIPGDFSEEECARELRVLAWNDFHPRPAVLAAAAFAPLAVVEYPEIGADGKPTGKTLRCQLELLGAALREHPDRETILDRAAETYIRASRGDAREIRRAAERISFAVRTLKERGRRSDGPDREIAAALRELDDRIEARRELDDLLRREAERHTSLADDYRRRFQTVRRPSPLAPPEADRFLTKFAQEDAR